MDNKSNIIQTAQKEPENDVVEMHDMSIDMNSIRLEGEDPTA